MGDTTSLSARKAALRKSVRALRRALPRAERREAARKAAQALARACRRWQARHVAVYLSMSEELDTAPLLDALRRAGCRLYAPRLRGARLRFVRLDAGATLRHNRYRIAEPIGALAPPLDLVVAPLVAFDAQGRRLGMGGGYYDRILSRPRRHGRPLRVGFAFAAQEVRAVPAAAHDVALDGVVTEHGLRRFR